MYQHILAATDFSDPGDRALRKASQLAIALGAKLTLVHVMVSEDSASPMYAEHEVRAQIERLQTELATKLPANAGNIHVDFHVRVGDAATEILAAVEEHGADLLVVSSNGQRGFTRWLLGTVTDRVVRGAVGDVLVAT